MEIVDEVGREPIDHVYFKWLIDQANSQVLKIPFEYEYVAHIMFKTEFFWFVHNDDNRAADGVDLRTEFLDSNPYFAEAIPYGWESLDCSVLEMFVALCRRLEFQTETPQPWWFKRLMYNLNLSDYRDKYWSVTTKDRFTEAVKDILETFMFRTYNEDGSQGGLFPLQSPNQDQRNVEIWYQLNAYIIENQ